jgi:hypothetical protein
VNEKTMNRVRMTEKAEIDRAPQSGSDSMGSRGRLPATLYPLVVTIAIAIIGHVLMGTVEHDGERLNIIGAAVFAILGLIVFELRERSQTARLLAVLEKARGDNWLIGHLESIVADYADIAASGDTLFATRAKEHLVNAVGAISETAEGHIDVQPHQESVFTIRLVTECAKTMDAISFQDEEWWSNPLGHEYLERHKVILGHGVKIRRVFVMPQDAEACSRLTHAAETQRNIGIDVRTIPETDLLPEQRHDLVIYDRRYVRWGATGEPRAARLSRNSDDIARASNIFEDAWLRSSGAFVTEMDIRQP